MTKKHFRKIAEAIQLTDFLSDYEKELFVKRIATICYETNPNFNYQKFFDACFK